MTIASIVKLAELKGAKRVDADRYHPRFLELENKLRSIPMVRKLSSLIVEPIRTGHTPPDRDIYKEDEEIHFVKTDTLREGLIDFENSDFLPARSLSERDYLRPKDVVVTIIGAHFDVIGRAAIFLPQYRKSVVNQNIAVIKTSGNILNPFYLMVFLNTRYGREQLWMLSRQTEQVNLNCREVEELQVPLFSSDFQDNVEELARNSLNMNQKSKILYSEAENLFLEELGLKDFKPKFELSYSTSLSKAFGVHRVDAEYFQPAYYDVISYLKTKFTMEKLAYLASKRETRVNPNLQQIYRYIEISDIRTDIGEVAYTERSGKELPPNARILISGGELLVSKVRPTRKAIAIVPNDLKNNVICTSAFTVFSAPSPLREYVFISLRSVIGLLQLEQPTTGTEYPTLRDEDVVNVLVPVLPKESQRKIALLVRQSYEVRRKARELLEEAKRKVEEEIESVPASTFESSSPKPSLQGS